MNLEKYRALFVDEATDHLADMGRALVTLDKAPEAEEATEAVDTLFRMAHSLKSMAASLSYDSIAELAHRLEDWMEPLRGKGTLPPRSVPMLLEVVRGLEELVTVARSGKAPDPRPDLLSLLETPARMPEGGPKEKRRKKA